MISAWFDPGLLTGACVYDFKKDELVLLDEFDYINTGRILDTDSPTITHVGWENYRIMKGPQTQAPWSLEVIGEIKYLCATRGYTMLLTAEPAARLVCTDEMIRRMDVYDRIKGKKDAKSSFQHFIAWCLRENILPEKWKEAVYGTLR